ncbi:MAG: hypothetical protein CR988_04270 [Treponema sp.]|nr:MAG: hypothetical protein CR988_04270 [Treponema sp.]
MNNLIPKLIHDKYIEGKYKGWLKASSLFMDLSGFTNMTEVLMKEGEEGAEVVSSILNRVFAPLIDTVYKYGGCVSGFLGDAFTAIFPKSVEPIMVVHCANEIVKLVESTGLQETNFGTFDLSAKVGVGAGKISWGIVGDDRHRSYYFRGSAIDRCTGSEKCCAKQEVVLDKYFVMQLPENSVECEQIDEEHFRLNKIMQNISVPKLRETERLKSDVLSHFFCDTIIQSQGLSGELRKIVSVFISFKNITTHKQIDSMVNRVFSELHTFGGYIKGIEFGDKGGTMLVVFGAPVSYEDNLKRALAFILLVEAKFKKKIRAGVTQGTVYAGIVGAAKRYSYDVLGDVVNISSRMMMKADWGSIWVSESVKRSGEADFNFKFINTFKVRGRNQTVDVFELLSKKNSQFHNIYRGKLVGRKSEEDALKARIKPILQNKFGGVVYVYGEPGIGKSRFTDSVIQAYTESTSRAVLQCDSILQKSLTPIIYFFKTLFNQNEQVSNKKREVAFHKSFEDLLLQLKTVGDNRITEIINELKRTESFFKALLGLNTAGTLYEAVESKLKFENTINAIKDLFKGLSLIKPLIIQVEDIHHIDEDSKKAIELLTRNVADFPFLIIATGRYNDDDSKPKLTLDDSIICSQIELKELDGDSVKAIAESWFEQEADDELLDFVIERTHSNPFYVEQFCLYLMENEFIEIKNNTWFLKKGSIGIPREVNSILTARIDRLSPELKELVCIASVLGREFDIVVLIQMLKTLNELIETYSIIEGDSFSSMIISTIIKSENVKVLLEEGSKVSLWQELSELKYIFNHALLVQTAYRMQLRDRLRNLHRVAADIIRNLYKDDPSYYADIAYHYEKGEIIDKTKEYLLKAADHFKSVYQNEKAIVYYDKLIPFVDNNEKLIEIVLKKADVLQLIGEWDNAILLLEETISSAKKEAAAIYLAKLKNLLGEILIGKGRYDEALILLKESTEIAVAEKNMKLKSKIKGNIGDIYSSQGNYNDAMKCFTEQQEICTTLNDLKGCADTILKIGVVYHDTGEYDKAMQYYNECKEMYEDLGYKDGYAEAIGNIGVLHVDTGNYKEAKICFDEDKRICEEVGNKNAYATAIGNIGLVYYGMTDYDEALKYFTAHSYACEELGNKKDYAIAVGNMGGAYRRKGDFENAMKCFNIQKATAISLGDKATNARAEDYMGRLYLAQGDYDNAMKCYVESNKLFTTLGDAVGMASSTRNIGEVYASVNDFRNALKYYDDAIAKCRETKIDYYLCNYLNSKALILFDFGKINEAKAVIDKSFGLSEEAGDFEDVFNASILKAKIEAKLGDKDEAIKTMLDMVQENTDYPVHLAELHYEIWNIIHDENHKEKALKLYTEIYNETPHYDYKKIIEKIKSQK